MKNSFEIPFNILKIENEGYHLQIQANINDFNCTLLIDTGASKTVLDLNFFNHYISDFSPVQEDRLSVGLGTDSMITHSATIETLKIGELILMNFQTTLLDLSHVNASYYKLNLPEIAGVLGGDLLMKHHAVINYYDQKLTLKY